jgi:hypothetical protein
MPTTIPLPDFDTVVYFRNQTGEIVAQAELLQLDAMLSASLEGLNARKDADRYTWVVRFAEKLSLLLQRSVPPTIAANVMKEVRNAMTELKKTFESIQTLPNSMDSIPADSIPFGEDSIGGIYPEPSPSENCETEPADPSSPPNEPTI